MNWASARSSRASRPDSKTKRAPLRLAAVSKSISPSASPRSKCCFGSKANAGRSPTRRSSTFAASSSPTGTSSNGRLGITSSAAVSASSAPFCSVSSSPSRCFIAPTLAMTSATSRPSAFALPMSFDSALRSDCSVWASVCASRRRASRAIRNALSGARPRRARAASKASGLSRIQRISCMARNVSGSRLGAIRQRI